jgi:hypothetical protein
LGAPLLLPAFGKLEEYRRSSTVLFLICQHAAFGDGAEAVNIHARFQLGFGIKGKQRVLGSVLANLQTEGMFGNRCETQD